MYSAKNIRMNPITVSEILSNISEYDIFKRYVPNFKELNQSFCSSLYKDENPGCRIYQKADGRLCYKDFGTGENYDCFSYVQRLYNLNFQECLNVIGADIGLKPSEIGFKPLFLLGKENIPKIENNVLKSTIEVKKRNFNIIDYNFWFKQYNISFNLLEQYEVSPLEHYIITKGNKQFYGKYTKFNPIYYYQLEENCKIYKPYCDFNKWMFFGSGLVIEGYKQLPEKGELLLISKALKDVMFLKSIGYDAISFNSETKNIPDYILNELKQRFKYIYILYDSDETGKLFSKKLLDSLQNGEKSRILDIETFCKSKDLTDYVKLNGLENGKKLIYNLICQKE